MPSMNRGTNLTTIYPSAMLIIEPPINTAPISVVFSLCKNNNTQPIGRKIAPPTIKEMPTILLRSGISFLTRSCGGLGNMALGVV